MAMTWKVVHDGKTPPPGEAVAPDERLSWGRTVGLGAQHVVAMFGATFVFPLVMGLNPQLAIMMSGIATICFLLIVQGKVPSYLGTSASFVGGVAAIRAQGGDSADVTGAILVAGLVLLVDRRADPLRRARASLHAVLPPAVTGAVVMLIGFNLAPVVADIYWPQDQWIALADDDVRDPGGGGRARVPRPDRDLPRPDLRLRALVARRPSSARSRLPGQNLLGPTGSLRTGGRTGRLTVRPRPGELGRGEGRRLGRLPAAQRRRERRRRLALADLLASPSPCWCCRP